MLDVENNRSQKKQFSPVKR